MTGQVPPKPPPPPRPPPRWPTLKQRTILREGAIAFQHALDEAIANNWKVQQIVVNNQTNVWLALVVREE